MSLRAILWQGLYDKNSDKLYATIHAQLLSESTYEQKYDERNEGQMSKHRKSCNGSKQTMDKYKLIGDLFLSIV